MSSSLAIIAALVLSASLETENHHIQYGGSVRSILAALRGPATSATTQTSGISQSLLRLTWESTHRQRLKLQFHGVQEWTFASNSLLPVVPVVDSPKRFQALKLRGCWACSGQVYAPAYLDRANARLSLGRFDVTAGRQAINFSHAYFFNPLDPFSPFSPSAFDRDYKPGVDALKVDLALGDYSGLNAVGVLGSTFGKPTGPTFVQNDAYGSGGFLRAYTEQAGWDFSALAGKAYGGPLVGLGFTGTLSTVGLRGEATYGWAAPAHPDGLVNRNLKTVIGIDRRFENSLHCFGEYLFNGAASRTDLRLSVARQAASLSQTLSRHTFGGAVSYEFLPLLRGQLSALVSASDGSALVTPMLTWSLSDEAELWVGALVSAGKRPSGTSLGSEYGTVPQTAVGEVKLYF